MDIISILKFTKGHNSIKMWVDLWYLISAHLLMTLIFVLSFIKLSKRVSELLSVHYFHIKIFKGT